MSRKFSVSGKISKGSKRFDLNIYFHADLQTQSHLPLKKKTKFVESFASFPRMYFAEFLSS